jgi:hypothetical protein
MAIRSRQPLASWPFALWTDLALRTAEMYVASAQVIGHRTHRMATAGPRPSLRDRREFARMGLEKAEAANESMWAVAEQFGSLLQRNWMLRTWQDAMSLSNATARLMGSGLKPIHSRATANARRLGRR